MSWQHLPFLVAAAIAVPDLVARAREVRRNWPALVLALTNATGPDEDDDGGAGADRPALQPVSLLLAFAASLVFWLLVAFAVRCWWRP